MFHFTFYLLFFVLRSFPGSSAISHLKKLPLLDPLQREDPYLNLRKWNKLTEEIENNDYNAQNINHINKLDQFRSSSGIPVRFWISKLASKIFPMKLWDSACLRPADSFKIGQAFISQTVNGKALLLAENIKTKKSFTLPLQKEIYFDPILIEIHEKIQTYFVPQGENPHYMLNEHSLLLLLSSELLIPLKVDLSGHWTVVPWPREKIEQAKFNDEKQITNQKVKCSDRLKNSYKTMIDKRTVQDLYKNFHCKKIYSLSQKKSFLALIPSKCSSR